MEGLSHLHVSEPCLRAGMCLSSSLLCLYANSAKIVYFFYPETANLTLEEIDFLFTDRARHPSLRSNAQQVNSSDDVLEHHAESKE